MTRSERFFSGTIAPTRISPTYRIALVVVAIAMLLLPVVYVALIVGVGVAVWWHLTANTWLLDGSGLQWRLLLHLTPLVVGVVLLFFMVKPILARSSTRQDTLPLDDESQPVLFAFIREITRPACSTHIRPMPIGSAWPKRQPASWPEEMPPPRTCFATSTG